MKTFLTTCLPLWEWLIAVIALCIASWNWCKTIKALERLTNYTPAELRKALDMLDSHEWKGHPFYGGGKAE